MENILFQGSAPEFTGNATGTPHHIAVRHSEFKEIFRTVIGVSSQPEQYTHDIVIFHIEIHNADDRWNIGTADPDNGGVLVNAYRHHVRVLDNHFYFMEGGAFGAGQYGDDYSWAHHLCIGRNEARHNGQGSLGLKCSGHVISSENISRHNGMSQPPGNTSAGFISQYGPENVWLFNNTVYASGSLAGTVAPLQAGLPAQVYGNRTDDPRFVSPAAVPPMP